ncbi:MAG: hypothetical protein HC794_04070 [Nitrospiraceae bacterium]|nr:hypothetical protein [Nitrospiraceae bacterium]
MNPRRLLLLLFLLIVLSAPMTAQEHPQSARGFVPDKVYSVGDIDAVNTFNGSLVVTIPVSPEIPIREGWSYGVKLTHHGSPWDFQLVSGTDRPRADQLEVERGRRLAGVVWRAAREHRPAQPVRRSCVHRCRRR